MLTAGAHVRLALGQSAGRRDVAGRGLGAVMRPNVAVFKADSAVRLHDLTVSYRGHPAVHHLSGTFGRHVDRRGRPQRRGQEHPAGRAGRHDSRLRRPHRARPGAARGLPAAGLGPGPQLPGARARGGGDGPVVTHRQLRRAAAPTTASASTIALAAVGLGGFGQRWLGELSAGQAQRVLFARVLVQDAGLILLDEPFNAIDARTTADLLALLHALEARVTHRDRRAARPGSGARAFRAGAAAGPRARGLGADGRGAEGRAPVQGTPDGRGLGRGGAALRGVGMSLLAAPAGTLHRVPVHAPGAGGHAGRCRWAARPSAACWCCAA
jgi:zinc/manganese transport system ATP-binding protein